MYQYCIPMYGVEHFDNNCLCMQCFCLVCVLCLYVYSQCQESKELILIIEARHQEKDARHSFIQTVRDNPAFCWEELSKRHLLFLSLYIQTGVFNVFSHVSPDEVRKYVMLFDFTNSLICETETNQFRLYNSLRLLLSIPQICGV